MLRSARIYAAAKPNSTDQAKTQPLCKRDTPLASRVLPTSYYDRGKETIERWPTLA